MFGAVGSFLGLFVIPIMSKKFTRRTIYQFCLIMVTLGYCAMYICGPILKQTMLLNIAYIIASIGIASMFVNQTIILADIVDYGEFKTGKRSESITFSMKGFLQKMAYTLQTIILFTGLGLSHYSGELATANSEAAKSTISFMCFGIPPVLMIISLIVFNSKFKIYGKLKDEIHDYIAQKRSSN